MLELEPHSASAAQSLPLDWQATVARVISSTNAIIIPNGVGKFVSWERQRDTKREIESVCQTVVCHFKNRQ